MKNTFVATPPSTYSQNPNANALPPSTLPRSLNSKTYTLVHPEPIHHLQKNQNTQIPRQREGERGEYQGNSQQRVAVRFALGEEILFEDSGWVN